MGKQHYLERQLEFDFMNEKSSRFQFGLKSLLGIVTFAAVGFAFGKTLTLYDSLSSSNLDAYTISFFGILSSGGYVLNRFADFIEESRLKLPA